MKAIILAGGTGSRLWPLSRKNLSKQFLKVESDRSLFSATLERILSIVAPSDVFISTGQSNLLHLRRELRGGSVGEDSIILRPEDQDTASSVLSCLLHLRQTGSPDDEIVAVFPSDHFIAPLDAFAKTLQRAQTAARAGYIVTFGIRPHLPETAYGYIKVGESKQDFFLVDHFAEKPDLDRAKSYVDSGEYLWNSGMFVFPLGLMIGEFERHAPEVFALLRDQQATSSLSFDKAVIEKSSHVAVIPADFSWTDVGSWASVYELRKGDDSGTVVSGNVVTHNVKNSFLIGGKKLIAGVNLDDILVVESDDAILVSSLRNSQDIKHITQHLERTNQPELLMNKPIVSIVTNVFSYRKPLPDAIRSVLTQTYPHIEYVLLDMGTPEWNAQAVAEAHKYDSYGKMFHSVSQPGTWAGIYDAMRRGIKEATGDIIAILNADDFYIDSHVIESVVTEMEKTGADVAWGDLLYVDEHDTDRVSRVWKSSAYTPGKFAHGWMPPHPTFFVRRSVYEKFGTFRSDLPIAADFELMLRFLEKHNVSSCYVPRFLVKMREGGNSNWKNILKVWKGNMECYRSFGINGLPVSPLFPFAKPISKVIQLFRKQ